MHGQMNIKNIRTSLGSNLKFRFANPVACCLNYD